MNVINNIKFSIDWAKIERLSRHGFKNRDTAESDEIQQEYERCCLRVAGELFEALKEIDDEFSIAKKQIEEVYDCIQDATCALLCGGMSLQEILDSLNLYDYSDHSNTDISVIFAEAGDAIISYITPRGYKSVNAPTNINKYLISIIAFSLEELNLFTSSLTPLIQETINEKINKWESKLD